MPGITLKEYERHVAAWLCLRCHVLTHRSHRLQRECPGCGRKMTYHKRGVFLELLKAYSMGVNPHIASQSVGCSYLTAFRHYRKFRKILADANDKELDEMFNKFHMDVRLMDNGRMRAKKGSKTLILFNINGTIHLFFPRSRVGHFESTLPNQILPSSIYYSGKYRSFTDLKRHFSYNPASEEGEATKHVLSPIDVFWKTCLERLSHTHGIKGRYLRVYLKEQCYRYNHPVQEIQALLFDKLIRLDIPV